MKFILPEGTFKNMPARAWTIIAIGITALLLLIGATIYKYGGIWIKVERAAEELIEEEKPKNRIRFDENGNPIQDVAPGTPVTIVKDGKTISIEKGSSND